jgi:hypothetical protein
MEDTWITRPELAAREKLPVATLAQWGSQGKGPKYAKFGRHVRYRLSDVIAWENAQFNSGDDIINADHSQCIDDAPAAATPVIAPVRQGRKAIVASRLIDFDRGGNDAA